MTDENTSTDGGDRASIARECAARVADAAKALEARAAECRVVMDCEVSNIRMLLGQMEEELQAERRKRTAVADAARKYEADMHKLSTKCAELRREVGVHELAIESQKEDIDRNKRLAEKAEERLVSAEETLSKNRTEFELLCERLYRAARRPLMQRVTAAVFRRWLDPIVAGRVKRELGEAIQ